MRDSEATAPAVTSRRERPSSSGGSPLLSVEEAAAYLNIAVWTLRHWVSDRKIPFVRLGRLVRFRQADLDAYISRNIVRATHGK